MITLRVVKNAFSAKQIIFTPQPELGGLRGIVVTGVVREGVRPGVCQLLVSVNFEENALSD